jgi:hypothetical protein
MLEVQTVGARGEDGTRIPGRTLGFAQRAPSGIWRAYMGEPVTQGRRIPGEYDRAGAVAEIMLATS